jgi:hypothetical protein
MFRLAKLYADLGRRAPASEWYRKALQAFAGQEQEQRVYVDWARRYLADAAAAPAAPAAPAVAEDPAAIEARYGSLAATGKASALELDRLAVARARLGKVAEARDAWRLAERADPVNADRARYSWRIADLATQIPELPVADAQGRPLRELSRADLEDTIRAQVAVLREARQEAEQSTRLKKKKRKELEGRIAAAKSLFAAGGLEYTARGHSLQELSFTGGFAPLVFHPDEWQLPVAE